MFENHTLAFGFDEFRNAFNASRRSVLHISGLTSSGISKKGSIKLELAKHHCRKTRSSIGTMELHFEMNLK